MTTAPIFKCIKKHPTVMADITRYAEECFNFKEHAENMVTACEWVVRDNNPLENDNVFGVYSGDTNEFIGVTGLWYDDRPPLDKLAFLRWTGLRYHMRKQGLSKPLIAHLWRCALSKRRHTLVEIAHTDIAKTTFQHMGFTLLENNERYIKPLLQCLDEVNGTYILTQSVLPNAAIDWEEMINLARLT